jgi:hypothetical protein
LLGDETDNLHGFVPGGAGFCESIETKPGDGLSDGRLIAFANLSTEGFRRFAASTPALVATGQSDPVPGRHLHPLLTNAFSRRTTKLALNQAVPDGHRLSCGVNFVLEDRLVVSASSLAGRSSRFRELPGRYDF